MATSGASWLAQCWPLPSPTQLPSLADRRAGADLLRDFDVAGGVEYALREGVTEQVRMNRDACLSTDVAQGRFKTRITKGLVSSSPLLITVLFLGGIGHLQLHSVP